MESVNGSKLRLVLDTNQIIGAGSRWLVDSATPRNQHLRLLALTATDHTGLYCSEIIDEYLRKLLERHHPANRAAMLIAFLRGAFTEIRLATTRVPARPRDPDDEVFLLCALDGDADYLVSEDRHLLEIADRYERPLIEPCETVLRALESQRHSNPPDNAGNPESSEFST